MGKTSIPFIIISSILILVLGLFYSPSVLPLLALVLLYGVWELWDEHVTEIRAKQQAREDPILFDPVYQLLIL